MLDTKPIFSVIMTSYNYAPYVGAAIESVLAQTFQDWELLIVDDCSTDHSWRIIQGFDDPRIKAHRHTTNLGACAAYNHALSMARGEYVASLDSDDLFLPTKLARQAAFFVENPEIDVCGTFVTEIDCAGEPVTKETPYANWFNMWLNLNDPARWLWQNRLCHSGAVVRRRLHDRVGQFDNQLVYTPDWQFWLRALAAEARFAVIHEPLVGYRNHGNNITHQDPHSTLLEHAKTSAEIVFPWLKKNGHIDFIESSLEGFLFNPKISATSELQARIAQILFSGSATQEVASVLMRFTLRREAEFAAKDARVATTLKYHERVESQWRNQVLVSAIVTFHEEGLLAHKTLLGLERLRRRAENAGISVQLIAVLDYADAETTRTVNSSPVIRGKDRIIEVSNGDTGISRNNGIAEATGTYIGVFDGGDFYSENWICNALAAILSKAERVVVHPERVIAFGALHLVADVWDMSDRESYRLANVFETHPWAACSFGIKNIYFDCPYQFANLDATGFGNEDWRWDLELISQGIDHVVAKETALYKRIRSTSEFASRNNMKNISRPSKFFNHPEKWIEKEKNI